MELKQKIAVITGAGSGIGQAAATQLAELRVGGLALVDVSDSVHQVARDINARAAAPVAQAFVGDATDGQFRKHVFDETERRAGIVRICVPAAGITRDALAVRFDKTTGKANIYPEETFRLLMEVNLL